MYGFSTLPRLTGAVLVACGVVCFFFFVRRQLGMDFPLIDVRLFSDNRVFGMSNLATLIHYCATFAVTFLMSLYLQHVKLLSPSHTGFILVMAPVLQALFSPFAGWLSDHREPRIIASTGMALSAAGLTGLAFISASTHIGLILLWLAMLGVGFALFSSPNVNAVMSSVETKLYGIASATLATMRLVGQMLSMGIAMLIFSCVIGDQPLGHDNSDLLVLSAKIILSIMAVTCVAGVFASLARGRVHDGRAAS
jgi:MFS family permease